MKFLGIILSLFALWAVVRFLESDEKYLKKTTEKLIGLSNPVSLTDIAILKRVEKMAKHIHFDVHFQIQIGTKDYKGQSLNKIRAMLSVYFKRPFIKNLKASDLLIKINAKDKKQAQASFDFTFTMEAKKWTCKSLLHWIKEEDWFIKTVKINSCFS